MKAKRIPASVAADGDRDTSTRDGLKSSPVYSGCPYCRLHDGHTADCPVAADIAATDEFDDTWFALHPLATELTRFPSWGETVQLHIDLAADLVDDCEHILQSDDDIVTVYRSEVAA